MSFRRRKSRIGPGFQAVIPKILSKEKKQELIKLYDYEQSLSEHCLTISSLKGPLIAVKHINMNNHSQFKQQQQMSQQNQNQQQIQQQPQQQSHQPPQRTVNDTSIDHRIDPICWDASKSHPPPAFNYHQYVAQYNQYPNKSLQQKLHKFQQTKQNNKKNNNKKPKNNKKNNKFSH